MVESTLALKLKNHSGFVSVFYDGFLKGRYGVCGDLIDLSDNIAGTNADTGQIGLAVHL